MEPTTMTPTTTATALEIERLANRCLISALKSHLPEAEFNRALAVALTVSEQVATNSQKSQVKKAVNRIAFGLPVSR